MELISIIFLLAIIALVVASAILLAYIIHIFGTPGFFIVVTIVFGFILMYQAIIYFLT